MPPPRGGRGGRGAPRGRGRGRGRGGRGGFRRKDFDSSRLHDVEYVAVNCNSCRQFPS